MEHAHLTNGNRVCIVGGGPAGSFAALHLLQLAQQQGLHLDVLIFEPRDFAKVGPAGCNRCAGILSSRLLNSMDELGLSLPPDVIQAELRAYAVHLNNQPLRIEQPDPQRRIVSIYRGGGPRIHHETPTASFDGFLLAQACSRGARHIPHRVRKVTSEARPVVHTREGDFPCDLLVLATGINSRPPLAPEFGYQPPETAVMAQDEYLLPPDWPGDQVSAFFKNPPGLTFGALIPKGQYLNVSLLGHDLNINTIPEFIELQGLANDFPASSGSLCGCTPRIAVGPGRGYFGSRWVAVGDAAVTRLYKDGIGSACFTAQAAMQTAVMSGISHQAFQRGYAPYCQKIVKDNQYGRLLFFLWRMTLRIPPLLQAWKTAIFLETTYPPEKRVHIRILWGMFSGDELYRTLFWLSVKPAALLGLARGLRKRK